MDSSASFRVGHNLASRSSTTVFLKEYDVLIWGRKTWENILSWEDDYVKDLKDINIIILSETSNRQNEFSNITYCNSIEDCLKVCENLKYEKLFIVVQQ